LLDDDDDLPPANQKQQQASVESSSSSLRPSSAATAASIDASPHKSVQALRQAIQDRHLRSLRLSGDEDAAEKFALAVQMSSSSRRGGAQSVGGRGRWEHGGRSNASHVTAAAEATTKTRNTTTNSEEHTSTTNKISLTTVGETYESEFVEEDDRSDSTGSETLSAILFNTPTPVSSPARSSSSKASKVTATTDSRSTVSGTPPRQAGSPQRWSSSPRMLKDPYGPNTRQLLAAFCENESSTGKRLEEESEEVIRKHKQPTTSSTVTYPATITVRTFPLEEELETKYPARAATATATAASSRSACTQASLPDDRIVAAQDNDIESQRPSGGHATTNTHASQRPSTLLQRKESGGNSRRFAIGVTIALLVSFAFLAGGMYWWHSSTQ